MCIRDRLGFVNRHNRRFVAVEECLLMDSGINNALQQVQRKTNETAQMSIRYGVNTNDFLIQPLLRSSSLQIESGQKSYRESLGGRDFSISSSSFFQTNTDQAAKLSKLVCDGLELNGSELVVDAYAGVGMFAVILSERAGKVIAIEESKSAVKDAMENIKDIDNILMLRGKTEDILCTLTEFPDYIVLDPPRSGCHSEALSGVINLSPKKIAYVSCDLTSLARDLKVLCNEGYVLLNIQPIDMFPQTHHVECLTILDRN